MLHPTTHCQLCRLWTLFSLHLTLSTHCSGISGSCSNSSLVSWDDFVRANSLIRRSRVCCNVTHGKIGGR